MRVSVVLAIVMAHTFASPAHAQSIDPAGATELFRQGRDLMQSGDIAGACARFGESVSLDEKVGTLINLSECEDKLGKIASARQHLQRAIDLGRAQNDDRVPLAQNLFEVIDKRVPRLTIRYTEDVPEGTTIKRDNIVLGAAVLGSSLPIEPGRHVVVVSAPNRADRTFEIHVAEGETRSLDVSAGDSLAPPPPKPAPIVVVPGAQRSLPLRPLAIATGSVGLLAVAGGAILGAAAIATNAAANDNHGCVMTMCDDQRGVDLRNQARTAGDASTLLFVAGTALVASSVVMWLIAPRKQSPQQVGWAF
jgi:hypothetical protein